MRALAWLVCTVLTFWGAAPARGQGEPPNPKRSIAVVEFRSGASGAPNLGTRMAEVLASKTSLAVMSPTAAQQLFGDRLGKVVADCASDAPCIADLGQQLGVDDIILIGVSELGDLILTVQRITVSQRSQTARFAETLPPNGSVSNAQIEAFLRQVLPAGDFERWGKIWVKSNYREATVKVDDETVGVTPLAPFRVRAPKRYRVIVDKSGFAKFRVEIDVTPDATVVVSPELAAFRNDAWYKRWWVLAIVGVVAVGAATTTAIVLSRDQQTDVPVMVDPF